MTKVANTKIAGPSENATATDIAAPFELSIGNLLKRLKLPGLDVDAMLSSQLRDVEALAQATQQVRRSLDSLADRQSELLMSAMYQFQNLVKEEAGTVFDRAEQAKHALGGALRNMRELAELTLKSHEQAFSTVSGRVQERLAQLGKPA
ncbi:MAG: hypothetical protein V4724_04075 [Pseudomonadota bacterium]